MQTRHCSACDGYGIVTWHQQARDGTRIEVVYRCNCPAGLTNYPSLAPNTGPPESYTDDERH